MSDLCDGFAVTDAFFGAPFVDVDEQRDEPRPHRYVHGGFEGTATRFALHFPPPEGYRERFVHCIGGGRGGSELSAMSPAGMFGGGFDIAFDNDAYLVDSNQGHIGADGLCPKAGDDSSIYGYRASAETARFARHAATRIYGAAPRYGYLFGGSGGANRAIACLEQVAGLWDGAVIGNGFGNMRNSFRTGSASFGAGRVLGDKLRDIADAMDVGGSGDPFVGLTTAQRDRLADVYRLGYPRGAEATMAGDIGIATWTLLVEELMQRDPGYFRAYWEEPGHRGHDELGDEVFDTTTTVTGIHTTGELADRAEGTHAITMRVRPPEAVIGVGVVAPLPPGRHPLTITVQSGAAKGRMVQSGGMIGDVLVVAPFQSGDGQRLGFAGIAAGDEVRIENRPFLAYCDWYRHHVPEGRGYDFLEMDGEPLYPQHPSVDDPAPQFGYLEATGRYDGKVIMFNTTLASPADKIQYERAVEAHHGDAASDHLRVWTIEGADYTPRPANPVRHVDHSGFVPAAMPDLIRWVELEASPPASTAYEFDEFSKFTLPPNAADRLGVQPVVRMTANGGSRAEVGVGEIVVFEVEAHMPPDAGTIVAAQCDFDGSASWPHVEDVVAATSVAFSVSHQYPEAGTYFPAASVSAHRDGDTDDTARQIHNLGRVRVVVT